MKLQPHPRPSRLFAISVPVAVAALGVGACSVGGDDVPLPYFDGGFGLPSSEAGVDGSEASTDGEVGETSTDASNDGSGSSESIVISQVQSRGTGGGNDEFIELYNGSATTPITLDANWTIVVRNATSGLTSCGGNSSLTLFTGSGQVIPPHCHFLLTTSAYSEGVTGDLTYTAGVGDAASLAILHSGATIDALCFSYNSDTNNALTSCSTPYLCEGAPAASPHDNTTGTNADTSLERKPGGTGGNTTDNNINSTDFATNAAPDPHNAASAAVP